MLYIQGNKQEKMEEDFNNLSQKEPYFTNVTNPPSRTPCYPEEGKKNILITSALPYVNNVPHQGNIIGCVLSGDVYARFCRLRGYNTLYICGTDEYGTATETKAKQENVTPKEICDKYYKIHRDIYEWFDISFDYFGRVATKQQEKICQDIFLKCNKNGYIKGESMQQLYCIECKTFLADRYVVGTCPNCKYDKARGDQCDQCQQQTNTTEQIEPRCILCNNKPTIRNSDHLFIELPKLEKKLEEFVTKSTKYWSNNSIQTTRSWQQTGLKDRCITRDLVWGTKVPLEKYTNKVFYVWFEAPIGYISITSCYLGENNWERWWKDPENVTLVQFMGKDNIPFHTVIFPSTLIGSGDPYVLVKSLSTTEYLNYEGTKFSKTNGIGIFGDQVIDTNIPCEIWRYYLQLNRPEISDTAFTWDDFTNKINTELLNILGNFIQRVLVFVKSRYNNTIPYINNDYIYDSEKILIDNINILINTYIKQLDNQELKNGLKTAMDIVSLGNGYMQQQKPWDLIENDINRCNIVIYTLVQCVMLITILFEPYMPSLSKNILNICNIKFWNNPPLLYTCNELWDPYAIVSNIKDEIKESIENENIPVRFIYLYQGHIINNPHPLIKRFERQEIEKLRKKYQGTQIELENFPIRILVGTVLSIEQHTTNTSLSILQIDVGLDKPRQIIARLVDYIIEDTLINKQILMLDNIKYARFSGSISEGMLLTGTIIKGDNEMAVALHPTTNVPNGTIALPQGCTLQDNLKTFDIKKKLKQLNLQTGLMNRAYHGTKPFVMVSPDKLLPLKTDDDSLIYAISKDTVEGSRLC